MTEETKVQNIMVRIHLLQDLLVAIQDDQHVIRLYGTRVANVVYVCIILLFITTSFYKRNESYREN